MGCMPCDIETEAEDYVNKLHCASVGRGESRNVRVCERATPMTRHDANDDDNDDDMLDGRLSDSLT